MSSPPEAHLASVPAASTLPVDSLSPFLRIRRMRRGDSVPLLAVFAGLSPASRELRYQTPTPRLRPGAVRALTDLDPHRHVALLATVRGRPVGIARWARDRTHPGDAEIAVEVVDDLQGVGIGSALLREAARLAADAGITHLLASMSESNHRARHWARSLGARASDFDPELFLLPVARTAGARDTDSVA